MKLAVVLRILGVVWVSLAGVLFVPLLVAVALGEPWIPFGIAIVFGLTSGGVVIASTRGAERVLGHREALLTVTSVWVTVCAIGSVPYFFHPSVPLGWIDASFESVAGFTTTGATVLSGLDFLPRSLLLWRSLTQWIGGMGIVLFGIAILPLLGVGGMSLFKAEAPGPTKDKMTPRIAETAKLLWTLYLGLTVATAAVLFVNGMSAFDAVNHAMTSISTAGFSTHDRSLGYFDSSLIRVVTMIAMLAGGTSFFILHRTLTGRPSWRDQPELRAYIGMFLIATVAIAVILSADPDRPVPNVASALESAAFHAASILTTTGYSTDDYDQWPTAAKTILLGLIFVGGMAGSTAGGPKIIRVLIFSRLALQQLSTLSHRTRVVALRIGRQPVDNAVVASSLGFLAMWGLLIGAGTLALGAGGADLVTAFSAAASALGNVGPALGAAGPAHTYAAFDGPSKLVLEALMILGRLEIYTVLVVLTPGFWRF